MAVTAQKLWKSGQSFVNMDAFCATVPDKSHRTAETEAGIDAASPIRMDFEHLLRSDGLSVINILPKQFNCDHRVLEFKVDETYGGTDCYVRGFIARTMIETQAKTNSTGLIVGTKADKTGKLFLFRPFSGTQSQQVLEVNSALAAAAHGSIQSTLTFAFRLRPTHCPTWISQNKVHIPRSTCAARCLISQ